MYGVGCPALRKNDPDTGIGTSTISEASEHDVTTN